VRAVLVTDEQSASFCADAVWRSSGMLACVNVVPGAGLTHALSGIVEAFMDNVPLLVLGCGIRRDTGMGFQLHDVDQLAIVRPVTKAQFLIERGEDLYRVIREACAVARSGAPGPVFVEIPANLYLFTHEGATASHTRPPPQPIDTAPVARAAALLSRARRPLVYAGFGAAGAADLLLELAERLEAPVATTFTGKGVFPESHPLALWPGFGDAAPPFAREIASECDVTVAIGCRFGEVATGSYGLAPPGELVHVDIEQSVLGRNYPAAVAVAADAADALRSLLAVLEQKPKDQTLRRRIADGRAEVRAQWAGQAGGAGVSPWLLLAALQRRLGTETVFTADSGNGTFLAVEMLQLDRPGQLLAPVDYSCMGYCVPAAIGAKLARPECPVAALAGDGAFLMTGLELLTAAHLGVPVAVFVLRDGELAQIAQFQRTALNRPSNSVLPDFELEPLCRSLGVGCLRLERNDEIESVLDRVLAETATSRPVVVDTAIDYTHRTWFTRGVVKTNLLRLPWKDRLRFVGRALARRITG
jgi:acetolactate synthase-1/2/3 large subunit